MKKLILLTCSVAAVVYTFAGPFTTQSFINGQSVVIEQPTSATALSVSGTSTAIKYTNDIGQLVTAGTNAAGITYGAWGRPVRVRSDALGAASVGTISITTPVGSTNTITLTFQRSVDGSNFDSTTTWSFTTAADTAAVGLTTVTNVPTWLTTGTAYLRCSAMSFATNAAGYTNGITSIRYNDFAP